MYLILKLPKVLVHCKIVNNDYQQDSSVLYTFVPNKPFGSMLEISPTSHIFLKTFNSEYNEIEFWLRDQNNKALEIEDRINLAMVNLFKFMYIYLNLFIY